MNHPMNAHCHCNHCPGASCTCGCQDSSAAAYVQALPPHCACGPACGCEAAEQGCVCH